VGQVTEENQRCRWIEVQLDRQRTVGEWKKKETTVYKVLVPERFLANGQSPLDHLIRGWRRWDDVKPQPMNDPNIIIITELPIILSKTWNDVRHLEKLEIRSKLGSRMCDGIRGTVELSARRFHEKWEFENRLHPDSPFGVVTSRWELVPKRRGGAAMVCELRLIDFGKGAKSAMPDAK
jgi:hypothetical protein